MRKSAERRAAYRVEMDRARAAGRRGDLDGAMGHLERAHILAQPWAWPHTRTHWAMLCLGLRRGDGREVAGQVLRLAFGWAGSLLGWLPHGNPGSARVPSTRPVPPPDDLRPLVG